ncbi:hypothetical protein QBC34DRAFT_42390 [Podospora aff. communis PSN243]|uniref:Uncharacterized protein n=1 Tax=Podospora aff. communis PSN243 TaxID=3040156 RepID=A0AAV9GUD1_9PEZI|nr:hypothetical protein QBC34DRAFT_42390 [Podospora aff. communis PSN243]
MTYSASAVSSENSPSSARPWQASFIGRLPWDGLLAISGVAACAFSMIFVIVKSDLDRLDRWVISPAVYLAIISAAANILLRYTFMRGVEISWWVAALKENTRVKDLHNIWLYSTSLWAAVSVGRGFSLVALASVLLAVVPASTPLVQRASSAASHTTVAEVEISVTAAQTLRREDGTGAIEGRSRATDFVTASFAKAITRPLGCQSHLCSSQRDIGMPLRDVQHDSAGRRI